MLLVCRHHTFLFLRNKVTTDDNPSSSLNAHKLLQASMQVSSSLEEMGNTFPELHTQDIRSRCQYLGRGLSNPLNVDSYKLVMREGTYSPFPFGSSAWLVGNALFGIAIGIELVCAT